MSELGRFLEVVYDAQDAFCTVRGTLSYWCNQDLEEIAKVSKQKIGRMKPRAPGKEPTIVTAEVSFFLAAPDRLRVEKREIKDQKAETSFAIVNRECWWSGDGNGRVKTGEVNSSPHRRSYAPGWNDVERHFCPASLRQYFVGLTLERIGIVQTAGRECVKLRAIPRAEGQLWPHWLPYGANEYEFHADVERGALLYIAGRYSGQDFETYEVTEASYDVPIDDALFTYVLGPEEQAHPAAPITEKMTLADAVARMPFVVLAPAKFTQADFASATVTYDSPRAPSRHGDLSMIFHGADFLMIVQSADDDESMANLEWEPCGRDEIEMAISEHEGEGGRRLLKLERHGTHVLIVSSRERESVIDLAASLVPAKSRGG